MNALDMFLIALAVCLVLLPARIDSAIRLKQWVLKRRKK